MLVERAPIALIISKSLLGLPYVKYKEVGVVLLFGTVVGAVKITSACLANAVLVSFKTLFRVNPAMITKLTTTAAIRSVFLFLNISLFLFSLIIFHKQKLVKSFSNNNLS